MFLRIVFWQPVNTLAFNHCACRRSAGRISYSTKFIGYISIIGINNTNTLAASLSTLTWITTALGLFPTLTKSAGARVIPILSMSAASPAVKYSVVNQAKSAGLFKAHMVEITVQTGKRLVTVEAVLR